MKTAFPADARARASCHVPGDFLYAKLRGRRSRLLEGERLRALAVEPSLSDLAWRLYPRERLERRSEFERHVLNACVAELAAFGRYLVGAPYEFYRRLLERYAVENLKVLLRLLKSDDDPTEHLLALPRELAVPAGELAAGASVPEFVDAIPLPHVRQCAVEALPVFSETGNRAYLEMAFDKGYWLGVWSAWGRLPAFDAKQCAPPIRDEFDAMRLLGTFRAAAVYALSWEEWEPFLPAGPGRIPRRGLRLAHSAPELPFVAERLPGIGRVAALAAARDIGGLEETLWRQVAHVADRQFYSASSALALLVSYFYLKRHEMRHLLGLAQMLRYGKTADEALDYLDL